MKLFIIVIAQIVDFAMFIYFIYNWWLMATESLILAILLGWLIVPIGMLLNEPHIMLPYIIFMEIVRRIRV